jgi:hypothetical protein
MRCLVLVHVAILSLAACGADDLDRALITSLPPGTAVGSAASGTYGVTLVTRACGGQCTITARGHTAQLCERGEEASERLRLEQSDGRLRGSLTVEAIPIPLAGGIDADGGFDVGGLVSGGLGALGHSGSLELPLRVRGTVAVDEGSVRGEVKLRFAGTIEGSAVSCTVTSDLTGRR